MPLIARNPATEEVIATYAELTPDELKLKLEKADQAFLLWRETTFEERAALMRKAGALFVERSEELGRIASLEMGKPITQAVMEAKKCALACEYYAANAEAFLSPKAAASDASESYVRFDPIGTVLAVMPWNFPYWQVARFAAPALMAGNVGVLKHASNVPGSAAAFEKIFIDAGFPEGVFQNLAIGSAQVESVLRHPGVKAVALTGSETAGSKVAALAGSLIKKSVLELGGSDPFIVLADADVSLAAKVAAQARLQNAGQSCIAAKRFIVETSVYDEFLSKFKTEMESAVIGNPLLAETTLGPVATEQGLKDIERQVKESVEKGAAIVTGGKRVGEKGYFYAPTILANITKDMPAYAEELFGPVASVIKVKDEAEAIFVANDTPFGLGSSVWTGDLERAKRIARKIRAGSVFVNSMVKSDPRLPFGGTGVSGYGRELSSYGIEEFVNIKTVSIA